MPIDRTATLRNAEKLLRQGRLEPAIAEYARVVEDSPRDWNTANILGDLYVRVGQTDKAVDQFVRIAESLKAQGFLPKAAALYKKILKLRPDHEPVMLQAAEIAGEQGFYADARAQLSALAARRNARGDSRGAAEVQIRLGSLDAADFDGRLAAAAARLEMDDRAGAVRDFVKIAADLVQKQRYGEAVDALDRAASVLPVDGEPDRTPIDDLLQTIAERQLQSRTVDAGLATLTRLLENDASRRDAVAALGCSIAGQDADAGLLVIELANRRAIAEGAWAAAAASLQELAMRTPRHLPVLLRLVEVCVDGGLDAELDRAQAQLADAYLTAGQPNEARYVAEDLVTRRPAEPAHVDRLRRTLVLLGEPDPDAIIAGHLSTESSTDADFPGDAAAPAGASESEEPLVRAAPGEVVPPRPEPVSRIDSAAHTAGEAHVPDGPDRDMRDSKRPSAKDATRRSPVRSRPDVFELSANAVDIESLMREFDSPPPQAGAVEDFEVDLSVVLDSMKRPAGVPAPPQDRKEPPGTLQGADIEQVFAQLRDEASRRSALDAAEQEFRRGLALEAAGDIDGCIAALQSASKAPKLRFRTASLLGRLFRERGSMTEAARWYERAAQAPAPTPDEYHRLLFDLAEVLEQEGEIVRALAVCLELQADAGDYRDVVTRVERLAKVQARG